MQYKSASTLLLLLSSICSTVLAAPAARAEPQTGSPVIVDELEDDTPGSGGDWNVMVDASDPRSLSEIMAEMEIDPSEVKHVYNNSAFRGFAGSLSLKKVNKMSVMSGLGGYEPDERIRLLDVQENAPWGLQRISQTGAIRNAPQDEARVAAFDFEYQFDGARSQGENVDIYIVDTGININHIDFDGRAIAGFSFEQPRNPNPDAAAVGDDEGHGTHCAGTAASTTFGVAKLANIIAVKVLGSESGSTSDILAGIDFIVRRHEQRVAAEEADESKKFGGSIASMSLGSPRTSRFLEQAIVDANKRGVHFSVASGNENQDACNTSPAGATADSNIVSVGAITIDDERATFSNFGECTTIYAPGQDITSTWVGGTNKINTISGTSMACPHVTGLMAYLLSLEPRLKTDTVGLKDKLLELAGDLTTDVGSVKVANNGFASSSTKKLKPRSFQRA